jgi:hypothetical protein
MKLNLTALSGRARPTGESPELLCRRLRYLGKHAIEAHTWQTSQA